MRKTFAARGAACGLVMVSWLLAARPAGAVMMTFGAAKDATLFESATGSLSGGGEDGIFVGRTGQAVGTALRRSLISFDLSTIPAGATINSVSLRLFTTMSSSQGPANTSVTLHRVLGDWGEGNVNPGGVGGTGGPAQTGDATWRHQFFSNDQWNSLGGDFVATASATANVGSSNTSVTWTSTSTFVADVHSWVNGGVPNFGWLLRGNEAVTRSARKFASSEFLTPTNRPLLTIDFTPPVNRPPGDVNNDGMVTAADVALMAASYGTTTTANNFNLGEFSGDGIVGIADLAILQRNLSPAPGSPAAVPEPSAAVLGISALVTVFAGMRRRRRAN